MHGQQNIKIGGLQVGHPWIKVSNFTKEWSVKKCYKHLNYGLYIKPTQLFHFIKLLCNENAEKKIWEWWLRRATDIYCVDVI